MLRANFFETKWITRRALALLAGLAIIFALLLVFGLQAATKPAHAATTTFTVNSTDDDGDQTPGDGECFVGGLSAIEDECTLRAAIQEANKKKGKDTINFDIPGNGPHTITVGSPLPDITKPVTIDGYTQGDSTTGTPADDATENTLTQPGKTNAVLKIVLDGSNVGTDPETDANGLTIKASNVVVKGLVINGFGDTGIALSGGKGHKIEGNFIGTNPEGNAGDGNGYGVLLQNTDRSTIGGTLPAARNLISGNSFSGVGAVSGSSGNKIQGNLIGTDKNGIADLGNDHYGVLITSAGSSSPSTNNTIGDSDPSDGPTNAANTIAFNGRDGGFDGVGLGPESTGNRILSNSIFSNYGLGTDLNPNGITANDGDDPATSKPDPDKDTGPNRLQNYPVLTSAQIFDDPLSGETTGIGGNLNSTPGKTFTIQFFSNPSTGSTDEGKTFLGEKQVTTDSQGNAPIDFATQVVVLKGEFITATATNTKTGDTSEFSQAREVVEAPPPVIGT